MRVYPLSERCEGGECVDDLTAASQQCANEGTCGRSDDRFGANQVETRLTQSFEQTGLPTHTYGAAASEDECACY
jgi:hypothetical protein